MTNLNFVYQIDLELNATTCQVRLVGRSLQQVLDQIYAGRYRNWNVYKVERLTFISSDEQIVGEPRFKQFEAMP
jgi:hypothetical protein